MSGAAAEGLEHAGRVLVGEQAEDEVEGPAGRDMAAEEIGDGAGGGGIVGAVEPELGLRRQQVARAGPGASRCSRAGQSAQPIAARSAGSGTASASLVAQHRHGERGVHRLVRAARAAAAADRARPRASR